MSTKCHSLAYDQILDSKSFSWSLRTHELKFGRERYGRPKLKCNRGHAITPIPCNSVPEGCRSHAIAPNLCNSIPEAPPSHAIVWLSCYSVQRHFGNSCTHNFSNPTSSRKQPFKPATNMSQLRSQNGQ